MNYIIQAIKQYANNQNLENGIDFTLQNDNDNGVYLKDWYVEGITKPTMEQLQAIEQQICNCCELTCLKEQKLIENQANFDYIYFHGVKIFNNAPINVDFYSCLNILGMNAAIDDNRNQPGYPIIVPPLSITWRGDDNQSYVCTEEEFKQLSRIVLDLKNNIQQKLSINKLAIAAATTIEELNLIDTDYSGLL